MSGKWQVNKMAEWCQYHEKCTGDPKWLSKAIAEVKIKNAAIAKKKAAEKRKEKAEAKKVDKK